MIKTKFNFAAYIAAHRQVPAKIQVPPHPYYNLLDNIIIVGENK